MTEPESTLVETTDAGEATEAAQGPREARYRVERNEARDQLAAAHERIARLQRAEIERLAAASLAHPDDLFTLSGNDLTDYLNEDGDVDPERVAADIEAIVTERPGLLKPTQPTPAVDRSQGLGAETKSRPTDFSSLLRG